MTRAPSPPFWQPTHAADRRELLTFIDTRPELGFPDHLTMLTDLRLFAPEALQDDLDYARDLRDEIVRCFFCSKTDGGESMRYLCDLFQVAPDFRSVGLIG